MLVSIFFFIVRIMLIIFVVSFIITIIKNKGNIWYIITGILFLIIICVPKLRNLLFTWYKVLWKFLVYTAPFLGYIVISAILIFLLVILIKYRKKLKGYFYLFISIGVLIPICDFILIRCQYLLTHDTQYKLLGIFGTMKILIVIAFILYILARFFESEKIKLIMGLVIVAIVIMIIISIMCVTYWPGVVLITPIGLKISLIIAGTLFFGGIIGAILS